MRTADTSRQLDVFRGFAAILMVLNHAGNEWLAHIDATSGLDGFIVFLGSTAPALFFTATGIGMGLSRRERLDWYGTGRKIVLLLVADIFLGWSVRRWIGLDFFAFCAVAMLAVTLVNLGSRPRVVALATILVFLLLRYGFVAHLQPLAQQYPILAFVSGIDGVVDVSYPLGPWLAFPLGGFILGRTIVLDRASKPWPLTGALLVLLSGSAVASLVLVSRGAVLHRWGSVSIAYFLYAVAIVICFWLSASLLERSLPLAAGRALQMRGPASLIVVPVHYAAIGLIAASWPPPYDPRAWVVLAGLLCCIALTLSKWIAICLSRLAQAPRVGQWMLPMLAVYAALTAWAVTSWPPLACLLIASGGEVLVALNLTGAVPLVAAATVPRAI